ncbi:MAG: hypothetical protein KF738_04975 [Burkholderiales bacterium]|nr:hypothetical protein [Burkholderiales bacterium]
MYAHPSPAWYAAGLRWIATGLGALADTLDHRTPASSPLEPQPSPRSADDLLLEARHRAHRGL